MADPGSFDRLTLAEVSVELEQLSVSAEQSMRAVALAGFYARGLRHLTPEDLLHEAFTQLRTGQRSWPRGLTPLRAFGKAMHSIASNARKKADYLLAEDLSPNPDSRDSENSLEVPEAEADPARIVEAQSELELARQAACGDRDMEMLLETWADGVRGQPAMQELGWDANRYNAVRKRLLRRLAAVADNGSKP